MGPEPQLGSTMELVLMEKEWVNQSLDDCSTWKSGPHFLTRQHSVAGSVGVGHGEQNLEDMKAG